MKTTPFSRVIEELRRGETALLASATTPALLVEVACGKLPTELDGRSPYPRWRGGTRLGLGKDLESPRYPYLEHASLVWIERSPRSTFTQIVSLGRGAENDLRFDLESLSAVHATFARSGERWFVQDHFSTNGTFLNGEKLPTATLRRLNDGDQLRFGEALKARFFGPLALRDFLAILHRIAATEPSASAS